MPGGLLNIIAYGNQNIILNGNPKKTYFKSVYAKYTNFGIQKFRIDYNGSRDIDPLTDSIYTFKIPRNAELLLDTYLVFQIYGVQYCRRLYQVIYGNLIIFDGLII